MSAQPTVPAVADLVVVGRLTQAYGVKGWLKVHSYTEPMENLLGYKRLYVRHQDAWQTAAVEDGRQHGKGLVLKLRAVDSPEQARLYSGCELAVELAELPPLQADEYYWRQLEGLQVFVEHPQRGRLLLGRVDHLLETGANDVLVVRGDAASCDQRERLIPYLPEQVVLAVDLAAGSMLVDWDPDF